MIQNQITNSLMLVVRLLANKKYSQIEEITSGIRLTASEIQNEIWGYGGTIIIPEIVAYGRIDIIDINNTDPKQYSVRHRLHTKEEGESDLEIQLTLIDNPDSNIMKIELDSILVP